MNPFDDEDYPKANSTARLERDLLQISSVLDVPLVSAFHDAAARGNQDTLIYFLTGSDEVGGEQIEVNKLDSAKNTALHWAAGAGKTNVMQVLIQYGANLNLQNIIGDTPLHRATWRDQPDSVKLLLDSGADFTIRNKQGKKALELARSSSVGALLQQKEMNLTVHDHEIAEFSDDELETEAASANLEEDINEDE